LYKKARGGYTNWEYVYIERDSWICVMYIIG